MSEDRIPDELLASAEDGQRVAHRGIRADEVMPGMRVARAMDELRDTGPGPIVPAAAYVDKIDVRDGLPSLTIFIDGKGCPDGPALALAMALRNEGTLPSKRVTLSLRSGAIRLCPDDLRTSGVREVVRAAVRGAVADDELTGHGSMDERAASQEGKPIAAGLVMVARLVERDGVTSEWRPVYGSSDSDEFARWAGDYLASMTAEGMESSVVVESWTRDRWNAFLVDGARNDAPRGG